MTHIIELPLLVIDDKDDDVVNELDVKYAFDYVGSQDKEYILFSRYKDYCRYDYGHLDLGLIKRLKKRFILGFMNGGKRMLLM